MDTTGRRQNPDEISTAALRYALGDHDGRNAQLDRIDAARNPDIPVPATPGDHVRITAGHLTGHTGTVRPWTEAPDSRDAYAPAVSPDSHAAVKLDGETVDTWAYIAHENLRRIESDLDEYECPEDGCDYAIGAVGPIDPENPTSMVVPVPGDRVLMTDGSTARVAARREVDGGVMLQVQRAGLDYAEWVGVEEIEAHLGDGRVHDPEPEGEPADIGEDDTPRPFQVGDEVLVDGEPGVIAEMRDEAARVDSTQALVEMTGFPFPAWDAVALTPDRTRAADSRQIELVRPAPTGPASTTREDTIVAILTDHYDLIGSVDGRMHCPADCDYSEPEESATMTDVRRHQAALILAAIEPERDAAAEVGKIHPGWGEVGTVSVWQAIRGDDDARGEEDLSILNVLNLSRPPAEVAAMLRRVADVLDGSAK